MAQKPLFFCERAYVILYTSNLIYRKDTPIMEYYTRRYIKFFDNELSSLDTLPARIIGSSRAKAVSHVECIATNGRPIFGTIKGFSFPVHTEVIVTPIFEFCNEDGSKRYLFLPESIDYAAAEVLSAA